MDIKECRIQKLTEEDLGQVADALQIDPARYPDLLEAMTVELERCNWTNGDAILSARIALAHMAGAGK